MNIERAKVLAVSSGGGHWEQLLIALSQNVTESDILFAVTKEGLPQQAGVHKSIIISDCNRDQPLKVLLCIVECLNIILRSKPNLIISTGAAPGLIYTALGRLVGAKTIWIDSVANVDKLSMSGKLARYVASIWLTQWEHLATPQGPHYKGRVL